MLSNWIDRKIKESPVYKQNLELISKIDTLNKQQKIVIAKLKKLSKQNKELKEIVSNNYQDYESAASNMLEIHLYNSNLKSESKKDKPLFLIGSGPSLKSLDLTILKNCYTMSFNRSYIAFKDWGFEPTYFAGIDTVVNQDNISEFKDLIENSSIEKFFFKRDKNTEENYSSFKTTLVEIAGPQNPNLDFTKRLRTSNTGLFGLQVALGLLGFTEVFLLGCDANYSEKIEGTNLINGKLVSKSDTDNNHFRSDYYGKGKVYNVPNAHLYHFPAWKAFYEQNIKNNSKFKIYNCAKEGRLTFFEYKDYKKLSQDIEKYERK